jgi:hypothetical protein
VESQAFFLDGCRGRFVGSVVGVLVLDGWDVVAPGVEAALVVPVDPSQDLELDVLQGSPWSEASDDLGLEEPVQGLGGSVVVAVALGSDGGGDAEFFESFGVANREVLTGFN